MSFGARYQTRCPACGNSILPGHEIETVGGDRLEYVHAECAEEYAPEPRDYAAPKSKKPIPVMPHGKTAADRCEACFIVHASGQRECW